MNNGQGQRACSSGRLIQALCDPGRYPHAVESVQVLETHISWVLLTGPFAYKIKKPVNLGFLDFSRLEQRSFYCREELRLNRRFAPQLYLDVIPIGGTPENPCLSATENVFEYALKMVQFPHEERLDRVLSRGELSPVWCDLLAEEVAQFHQDIEVAASESLFGDHDQVHKPIEESLRQIASRIADPTQTTALSRWCRETHASQVAEFTRRKMEGFIRECHGDLHLENMVRLEGKVVLFDCIEFSERLRWIDVASDLAFVLMDLTYRNRADLANRLVNAYLEITGDYGGLAVLRYYLVYRALVRASVSCIRASQSDVPLADRAAILHSGEQHLELAESYTRPLPPILIITHGPSGSGKTTYTQALVEAIGAIRIRSDIERKRLVGLSAKARSAANAAAELYSPAMTSKTYEQLAVLARMVLDAGHPAIVDATNLKHSQRQLFRQLADELRISLVILDFQSPESLLRERLEQRSGAGQDASEATVSVLEHQLCAREELTADELAVSIGIEAESPMPIAGILQRLGRVAPKLGALQGVLGSNLGAPHS